MHRNISFLFFFLLFFSSSIQAQFIEFEDGLGAGLGAEELAMQILQNNDFIVTNVTYEGFPEAMGSFLGSETSPIGINHGIVLTTGRVVSNNFNSGLDGLASDFANSSNESTATSPDLMMLDPDNSNNDVANLIIEFIPNTDTLVVDFVFGSEEYPEYVCTGFNDVFGLFLTGPGIAGPFSNGGENIARVPGSDEYISINNIHPDIEGCPAQNEEYYISNTETPISLDGYTTVIPIRYPVIPFETYTMTLSIADKADNIFDSATFIQFSDCTSGFCNFFNPKKALIPENCEPANVYFDLSNAPTEVFPLEISLGGNAENGTDYETLSETYTLTAANPILDFDIVPIMDSEVEGIEDIELSVSSNGEYVKSVFYYLKEEFPLEVNALNNCSEGIQLVLSEAASPVYDFHNNTEMVIAPVGEIINSPIEVSGLPFSELFSPGLIKEVCIEIDHNWTDDVDIYLKSPNGQSLTLSTDNGSNGNDYINTCFSPTATNSIRGDGEFAPNSLTPFSGKWLPEGQWSNLLNTSTNGTWTLQVKDDSNGFTGSILAWSISFHESVLNNENILWSNGEIGASIDYTGEFPLTISAEITNSTCNTPLTFDIEETEPGVSLFSLEETTCDAEYMVAVEGQIFDIDNPTGEILIEEGSYTGCDSLISVNLTYLEPEGDVYMSETFTNGATVTIEDTVFDTPGFYSVTVNPQNGCPYEVHLSFLFEAPNYYYNLLSNQETTEFECGVGGDYCLNIQNFNSINYDLILNGETIGNTGDFPTCTTVSERRFDIPTEIYDMSRVWSVTSIGGSSVEDGFFSGPDEFLQHLDFLSPFSVFYGAFDISIPKIITRNNVDIESITILDVNDMTEIVIPGALIDAPTGVLLPLSGTESQISIFNPNTETTESYDLNVSISVETDDNMTYWDGIITNEVINTINIEAAADDLCGPPVSAVIACEDDEIVEVDVLLNEDGTATVTGTVLAVDFTDVYICVEFCDAFGNCETDTYILLYELILGTEEINSLSQSINIFPNPAQNEFIIYSEDDANSLKSVGIFTLNGQEVRQEKIENQAVIDASELAAGVYILKIDTEYGVARKRLVVTR